MSTQADQARIAASVAELERTPAALPAVVPWALGTAVPVLVDFAVGLVTGGKDGGSGDDGDKGDKGGAGRGRLSWIPELLKGILTGIAGGAITDSLTSAGEEQDGHEDAVDRADDALDACDRTLEGLQSQCADAVENCIRPAVAEARRLVAEAVAVEAESPETAAALKAQAVSVLEAVESTVESLLSGRNSAMEKCLDQAIEECTPAAEEGNCRVPLVCDPVPEVRSADCDVAPLPAPVEEMASGPEPVPTPAPEPCEEQVAAVEEVVTKTASVGSGAVSMAGAVSGAVSTAPTFQVPGPSVDVGGWLKGAVDTVVDTAVDVVVENSGTLVDIDLNLCPPESPVVPDTPEECEPPTVVDECPPEPEPEPEPCEPEPEPCEPEEEPDTEPEPEPPPPPEKTVDPERGFDKNGYIPEAPAEPAAPADPEVEPSAVGGPHDGGTDEEPEPSYDGWTPDLWVTGDADAQVPETVGAPVERSGEW